MPRLASLRLCRFVRPRVFNAFEMSSWLLSVPILRRHILIFYELCSRTRTRTRSQNTKIWISLIHSFTMKSLYSDFYQEIYLKQIWLKLDILFFLQFGRNFRQIKIGSSNKCTKMSYPQDYIKYAIVVHEILCLCSFMNFTTFDGCW